MTRRTISSGSVFEELAGYSRAVVDGDWILISGTAGYDFTTGAIPSDAAEQARQCLKTIDATLQEAGGGIADIVRVRVFLSDRAYVQPVSEILGRTFADPRPTNTTIICGFAMPEMKVEIEATARKRSLSC
jgi:enamine deaminase RidA (YjgF/YER057c/UK114 family)